jgi:hypothetical protein
MNPKDYLGIIPANYTGKAIEAEASAERKDNMDAKRFYEIAKGRLLNVDEWHRIAGIVSATFQLIDKSGKPVERNAEKGDYIRVDIPGPGSKEGDGYDWVYIEELKEVADENIQSIGFRVRPSANPFGDAKNIAHFYDDSATSNFLVTRENKKVTATIIDRNVKPNDDTESVSDKLRHFAVGVGAIASFSKIQWQNLADGLVKQKG